MDGAPWHLRNQRSRSAQHAARPRGRHSSPPRPRRARGRRPGSTASSEASIGTSASTGHRHRARGTARLGSTSMTPTGHCRSRPAPPGNHRQESTNLADILERVLDKGIVIAGDIRVNLLDIELLTIKIRLLVASVDKAREIGIDWWEHDPTLSSGRTRRRRGEPDAAPATRGPQGGRRIHSRRTGGDRRRGDRPQAGGGLLKMADYAVYVYAVGDAALAGSAEVPRSAESTDPGSGSRRGLARGPGRFGGQRALQRGDTQPLPQRHSMAGGDRARTRCGRHHRGPNPRRGPGPDGHRLRRRRKRPRCFCASGRRASPMPWIKSVDAPSGE